ncbi:MAG: hypothetical protein M1426_00255, partial [Patescibacteria group bacterium]|nr:hypothetical protein [Patescibacteria group bacterium]
IINPQTELDLVYIDDVVNEFINVLDGKAHAEDLGEYYRVPADSRDLNYSKYFVEGEEKVSYGWEYTSHNTKRLDIPAIKQLLLKIDYVQEELTDWKNRR